MIVHAFPTKFSIRVPFTYIFYNNFPPKKWNRFGFVKWVHAYLMRQTEICAFAKYQTGFVAHNRKPLGYVMCYSYKFLYVVKLSPLQLLLKRLGRRRIDDVNPTVFFNVCFELKLDLLHCGR